MKRTKFVVAVALCIVASTAVQAFGILEGLAVVSALLGKGGKPEQVTITKGEISMTATPVMAVPSRTGMSFTLEPMFFNTTGGTGFVPYFYNPVFPILKPMAPDGNPIMLVPIDWQPNGKSLENLLVTLDGEPITKTMPARTLVQNEGAWLRHAVKEANRDLCNQHEGQDVPDTFFEPFIALSKDVSHQLTRDKRHNFKSPTGSVQMMLVFPMGNLFARPHFVACNLKQPGRGDQSYNCSFHFRILDDAVATPIPFETLVPPDSRGVPSATPSYAQPQAEPSRDAPADNHFDNAPPTRSSVTGNDEMPHYVRKYACQVTQRPLDRPWSEPCIYTGPEWCRSKGISLLIVMFVRADRTLCEEGSFTLYFNDFPAQSGPVRDLIQPGPEPEKQETRGVVLCYTQPDAKITVVYRQKEYSFKAAPAGKVLWMPLPAPER